VTSWRISASQYGHGETYEIKAGDTVIDIGANCGEYAMFCASRGAEVYAVEADPCVFLPLVMNVRALPQVKPFNFAI
jgi:predicted RNA methylase